MTPLGRVLQRRIAASGPISLAEYMAECLLHPEYGYYTRGGVLGAEGDFTTAPEISQMFGELVGLTLAQAWLDQGRPAPFVLAEPGPGRGTLMRDVLRAMGAVPGLREAAQVHLVEASPALRASQRDRLQGHDVTWHDRLDSLPEAPLFLVANEFLDALPIRQFQRDAAGWRETVVGLDAEGALILARAPASATAALERHETGTALGTALGRIVEICPSLPAHVDAAARRIAAHGGAALFIDYGGWDGTGDTFQAVARHAPVDPLAAPGEADLTAHVNFAEIARAGIAAGVQASAMTPQGTWLTRLGIDARAERLAAALAPGPRRESHFAAYRRLTLPTEMGSVFKVIGLVPPGAPWPAGLDP